MTLQVKKPFEPKAKKTAAENLGLQGKDDIDLKDFRFKRRTFAVLLFTMASNLVFI